MSDMIVRYPLQLTPERQTVPMPAGAKVYACGQVFNQLCVWALVNTAKPVEQRTVRVVKDAPGTSIPFDDPAWTPVGAGTVQLQAPTPGALPPTYHLFVR